MAIYLRAADGAYSDRVLVAGDPGRIARLGQGLDQWELVTEHRGLVGFTGYYKGVRVSVQSSGMGCPSMAMVGAELLDYGVNRIIRIGTCSAFASGVMNGDMIVVTGAAAGDGTTRSLSGGAPYVCVPDFALTARLSAAANEGELSSHLGPIVTVDVEPHLSASSTAAWREQGLLAVEMESAALFHLAMRANARGSSAVEAACVLTVSDGLEGHPDGAQRFMSDDDLEAATAKMHHVALEALIS
ncbi:MAG: phosphorylase family protein [Ferrimicrobium sp.]